MTGKPIQITFPEHLYRQVKARNTESLSEAMREMVARYLYFIDRERASLVGKFTAGELCLLADANNGTAYYPETIQSFDSNAEDTEDEKYTAFGVDRGELLAKLKGLTIHQTAALVDAIERFWEAASISPGVDPAKLLDS